MATLSGTSVNDSLTGTSDPDLISGLQGRDTLIGAGGNDTIYGEGNVSPYVAGAGETGTQSFTTYRNNTWDVMYVYSYSASTGAITLVATVPPGTALTNQPVYTDSVRILGGAPGTGEYYQILKPVGTTADATYVLNPSLDIIDGGDGNDRILGQLGADTITGGLGNDTIDGGVGADNISGGDGADVITGGAGNDVLNGGTGADTISGGDGADTISGGGDNDYISGGSDNDRILADAGDDRVFGDAGNDTIWGGTGADTITDSLGDDSLLGEAGNDVIDGGVGNDVISGGADNDTLDGYLGNDTISGDGGADLIDGGAGDDSLSGGDQNDTIRGQTGNDIIDGGDGNDVIYGNSEGSDETAQQLIAGPVLNSPVNYPFTSTTDAVYTVNGVTYTVAGQFDTSGVTIISRVNADGSLTEVDRITYNSANGTVAQTSDTTNQLATQMQLDGVSTGVLGNGLAQPKIFDIGGKQVLFLTSRNGTGITAWDIGSDGLPDYTGGVNVGSSQNIIGTPEVYQSAQGGVNIYVVRPSGASGTPTIDVMQYDPASGNITQTTNLDFTAPAGTPVPQTASMGIVDGNAFLITGGTNSLSVFAIDAQTGALSFVETTPANLPTTIFGSPTVYDEGDGPVFVTNANTTGEEFVVYRLEPNGDLVEVDRVGGQGDFIYAQESYMDGKPVVVTVDPNSSVVRVFTLDDAGKAQLRAEITGFTTDSRPPHFVESDGKYYLVDPANGNRVELTLATSGTSDDDRIDAGLGDDLVYGGAGNDTILGNVGIDTLYGDAGNDSISGGDNNDLIDGGDGADRLYGDAGNDSISGGEAADLIGGGIGDDTISGDAGSDTIDGGAGADIISGGLGDDSIRGGTENDNITGGIGADALFGDAGNDTLAGNEGDDILDGGAGIDSLSGGAGNDTLTVSAGDTAGGGNDRDLFQFDTTGVTNGSIFTVDGGSGSTAAGDADDFDRLDLTGLTIVQGSINQTLDADGNSYSGTVDVTDSQGNVFTINYTEIEEPLCFARGTMIRTARGDVAVENLKQGDLVETRDNGLKPIFWIGSRILGAQILQNNPKLYPIRVRAGAFGQNSPARDLILSPQHRVLVRSRVAQRMFGENEVLVAVKQLLQIDGIDYVTDFDEVEYFHFLFDQHEIVYSNGAETESLFTGPQALKTVTKEQRTEILTLFPELADLDYTPQPARTLLSGRLGRKLSMRLHKNRRSLVEEA